MYSTWCTGSILPVSLINLQLVLLTIQSWLSTYESNGVMSVDFDMTAISEYEALLIRSCRFIELIGLRAYIRHEPVEERYRYIFQTGKELSPLQTETLHRPQHLQKHLLPSMHLAHPCQARHQTTDLQTASNTTFSLLQDECTHTFITFGIAFSWNCV